MNALIALTDEQLVTRYAEGQDEAFDILLDRHKDKLFSYILYTVQDIEEANDVFQETFTRAITMIRSGRYAESGRFYPWLTCIAHNLAMDMHRRHKSQPTISTDNTDFDVLNNADIAESYVEEDIINAQTLDDVKALIERLPAPQREIVHMRYYQNLSFAEIAKIKGESINTCLGRMHYSILNMRKMAQQSGVFRN